MKIKKHLTHGNSVIIYILILTLLSKVTGFLRELFYADLFGTSWILDSFLISFYIPTILFAVFGAGIRMVFIPGYAKLKSQNVFSATQYFNTWKTLISILMLIFVIVGVLSSEFLVKLFAPKFDGEQLNVTIIMTRWLFPSIFLMAISGLYSGLLNANKIFLVPIVIGIINNLSIIVSLLIFTDRLSYLSLIIGTLLGLALQVIIQHFFVKKIEGKFKIVVHYSNELTRSFKLLLPVFFVIIIGELNIFIDKMLASGLQEGSIASLNYAYNLMNLPLGITVYGLFTYFYPNMIDKYVNDRSSFENYIKKIFDLVINIVFPIFIFFFIFKKEIITIFYYRGAFTDQSLNMTISAFTFYSFSIIFMSIREYINRVFWAIQDTKTPMVVNLFTFTLNILLNIILIKHMGHSGLAMATSISYLISCVLLIYLLKIKKNIKVFDGKLASFLIVVVTTFITYIIHIIFKSYLQNVFRNYILNFLFVSMIVVFFYIVTSVIFRALFLKGNFLRYIKKM